MKKEIIVDYLDYCIENLTNDIKRYLNEGYSIDNANMKLKYVKNLKDNIEGYLELKSKQEERIEASFAPSYLKDSVSGTEAN